MPISVEKAVIARITKAGKKFEILVDPERALEVKGGKELPDEDWIAAPEVYEDSKKGLRAPDELLGKTFGTSKIGDIARKIVRDGEIQLTTEQRRKMLEDKRKYIITLIARQGMNPKTGLPHPAERISNAMDEARVKIELSKRPEDQVEGILTEIQKIIPIRFEKIRIAIKIPAQFAGKASSAIRAMGKVSREEWKGDGSYLCLLEVPAGIQQDVYDKINGITHGQNETKIIKDSHD
jgi:ribosome maturation protein SDO1